MRTLCSGYQLFPVYGALLKVIEQKKEHHIHHVENQQAKMPYLLFIWKCVNLPNNKQRTQRENNGQ